MSMSKMPVSILPMALEVLLEENSPGTLERVLETAPEAIRPKSSLLGTQVGVNQVL